MKVIFSSIQTFYLNILIKILKKIFFLKTQEHYDEHSFLYCFMIWFWSLVYIFLCFYQVVLSYHLSSFSTSKLVMSWELCLRRNQSSLSKSSRVCLYRWLEDFFIFLLVWACSLTSRKVRNCHYTFFPHRFSLNDQWCEITRGLYSCARVSGSRIGSGGKDHFHADNLQSPRVVEYRIGS